MRTRTWARHTLGMPVNLETDIFAKYAEKLLQGDREGISALSEGVEASA